MKKYRHEWKYNLSNQELSLLKSRISEVLETDPYSNKGKYLIHSLYFDDYKDTSSYDTESGISKRFKYRIRYYGDDLSYIVLERKEKINGMCHKESCKITKEEYESIISGNIFDIVYDTNKKLIKELSRDMMMYGYKPKIIIDYERYAYVELITNVRVTFDTKISASYELDKFLTNDYLKFYIGPSNYNVLEVKFDDILPSYIKNIVESYDYTKTFYSKYYYGRSVIDNYMKWRI